MFRLESRAGKFKILRTRNEAWFLKPVMLLFSKLNLENLLTQLAASPDFPFFHQDYCI